MAGWSVLSLIPDDGCTYELADELDKLTSGRTLVNIGDNVVHARFNGYHDAPHQAETDRITEVCQETAHLWTLGARIDANNTTDAGDGWLVESAPNGVEYGERIEGAGTACGADVALTLEEELGVVVRHR